MTTSSKPSSKSSSARKSSGRIEMQISWYITDQNEKADLFYFGFSSLVYGFWILRPLVALLVNWLSFDFHWQKLPVWDSLREEPNKN
jgi:hypothetical protein